MRSAILLAAIVLAILPFGPASAATCLLDAVKGALTTNASCYQGEPRENDSADALSSAMAFGIGDFVLLAEDDDPDGTNQGDVRLLTVTGSGIAGTIRVASSVFDAYGTVSLVLKGPNSPNSTPNTFIAYLVERAASYAYLSPYLNRNGKRQEISHVSLYAGNPIPPRPALNLIVSPKVSESPSPVPLPATLVLLAGALGGLRVLRGRKAEAT